MYFFSLDNIPAEILARGPEAVDSYVKLRQKGNAPLFRGRVFVLGQDQPSNIRFQSALLNNTATSSQTFAEIVECHHWCRINNKGQWRKSLEPLQKNLNLSQDYETAIARNIAMEILKTRKKAKKIAANKKAKSSALLKNSKKSSAKVAPATNESYKQLPPNMIGLVEGFLKELEQDDHTVVVDLKNDSEEEAFDIGISLWLLGGHCDLMPTFFHFLSLEAVYLLVFDLAQDLKEKIPHSEMTHLDYIVDWINLIHHKSKSLNNIIIIGTNRALLHADPRMQESMANIKFEAIREILRGQSMESNVCQTYFAIDENATEMDSSLKMKIFHALMRLPRMGMRIPQSWVHFEKTIQKWMEKGIKFAQLDEIFESYEDQDFISFQCLLSLYCDLGLIFIVDKLVIFDTQSFVSLVSQLVSPAHFAQLVIFFSN